MIWNLIKLGAILVLGVLVYNRFLGTDAEKESSKKVFGQMRGLVVSVRDLVKEERQKFDKGKYDKVMDQLGGAYKALRDKAEFVDKNVLQRLDDLEKRKQALQKEVDNMKSEPEEEPTPAPTKGVKRDKKKEELQAAKAADKKAKMEQLQKEMESLLNDSEQLLKEAEQN